MERGNAHALLSIRVALKKADLAALEKLTKETEALASHLLSRRLDKNTLLKLRKMAHDNLPLIEAARRGLRDAAERKRMLSEGSNALRTYDKSGQISSYSSLGRLEQKA